METIVGSPNRDAGLDSAETLAWCGTRSTARVRSRFPGGTVLRTPCQVPARSHDENRAVSLGRSSGAMMRMRRLASAANLSFRSILSR